MSSQSVQHPKFIWVDSIDPDFTLGLGVPDASGNYFHPNELGHKTITTYAIQLMIDTRAEVLGLGGPSRAPGDGSKCWQIDVRKGYANVARMTKNFNDSCNNVQVPDKRVGWKAETPYNEGKLDDQSFLPQLLSKAETVISTKTNALKSLDRLSNGCDGKDRNNPTNRKFVGQYLRGDQR